MPASPPQLYPPDAWPQHSCRCISGHMKYWLTELLTLTCMPTPVASSDLYRE